MAHKGALVPPTRFEVQVGERGRLVLPARLRKQAGIRVGDRLLLLLDKKGETRLASLRRQVEKCCGMLAGIAPKRVLSEELIAERRREAQVEEEP
jgi:AbrB family looped-hinge helix DNA binding protein